MYCSTQCQSGAWRTHKVACKAARKAADRASNFRSDDDRLDDAPLRPTPRTAAPASHVPSPPPRARAVDVSGTSSRGSALASTSSLDGPLTDTGGLKAVADATGYETVVEAMRGHVQSASTQARACTVLRDLMNSSLENALRAAQANAFEAVLRGMHAFRKIEAVRAEACYTLMVLTSCGARHVNMAGRNTGAVGDLVTAMRAHATCAQLQGMACAGTVKHHRRQRVRQRVRQRRKQDHGSERRRHRGGGGGNARSCR